MKNKHELLLLEYTEFSRLLRRLLTQEVRVIDNEIARTQQLFSEAIQGLSIAFKQVNALSEQQRLIIYQYLNGLTVNSVDSSVPSGHDVLRYELEPIAAKLEQAVTLGIRSLQFEDLANQALASIKDNADTLSEITKTLALLEQSNVEQTEVLEQLQQKCQEIALRAQEKELRRRVVQTTMNEGDIELF